MEEENEVEEEGEGAEVEEGMCEELGQEVADAFAKYVAIESLRPARGQQQSSAWYVPAFMRVVTAWWDRYRHRGGEEVAGLVSPSSRVDKDVAVVRPLLLSHALSQ